MSVRNHMYILLWSSERMKISLVLLLVISLKASIRSVAATETAKQPPPPPTTNKTVKIINHSQRNLQVFSNENGALMSDDPYIPPFETFELNAIPGQGFYLQPPVISSRAAAVPSSSNTPVAHALAKTTKSPMALEFNVTEEDDQVIIVTFGWSLKIEDAKTPARAAGQAILEHCQKTYTELSEIYDCVKGQGTETIIDKREDIHFYNQRRHVLSRQWENYTCHDSDVKTTVPLKEYTWQHTNDKKYQVQVLHDYLSSRIHIVEDFITEKECQAVMDATQERLQGTEVQAHISHRVYAYAKHVLGLDISEEGQESLMTFQYFDSNDHSDIVESHCDGPCEGRPHKRGAKVASMVMYCEVPSVGGHVSFRNAAVHIAPSPGNAIFFSYIDPESLVTDKDYTSHSDCPIYAGAKKIVTQWVKLGTDGSTPADSLSMLHGQRELYFYGKQDEDKESEDTLVASQLGLSLTANEAAAHQRKIHIFNESPVSIAVVFREDGRFVSPPEGVVPGGKLTLNTVVEYHYDVFELPHAETKRYRSGGESYQSCLSTGFRVTEGHEQEITITEDFEAVIGDTNIYAEKEAERNLENCRNQYSDRKETLKCLERSTTEAIHHWNREWKFHSSALKNIARQLEEYICNDIEANYETYPHPLRSFDWVSRDQVVHKAHILHSRPASQIHVISDFIRQEECELVLKESEPNWERARVRDGKGGTIFSDTRRAWQAAVRIPWYLEQENYPVALLGRRIFDYADHVLGTNIPEIRQEPLMTIKYNEPVNETAPLDYYGAHCDGNCDGKLHVPPQRVATMIMYCEVPEAGGHTHFRNAGVHVRPTIGMAVFFSYMDSETNITDSGFTEHSGCPVYKGGKQVITQWIRWGVNASNANKF